MASAGGGSLVTGVTVSWMKCLLVLVAVDEKQGDRVVVECIDKICGSLDGISEDERVGMLPDLGKNLTGGRVAGVFSVGGRDVAGPMYQPEVPCVAQVLMLDGFLWATTWVLGGASGV